MPQALPGSHSSQYVVDVVRRKARQDINAYALDNAAQRNHADVDVKNAADEAIVQRKTDRRLTMKVLQVIVRDVEADLIEATAERYGKTPERFVRDLIEEGMPHPHTGWQRKAGLRQGAPGHDGLPTRPVG